MSHATEAPTIPKKWVRTITIGKITVVAITFTLATVPALPVARAVMYKALIVGIRKVTGSEQGDGYLDRARRSEREQPGEDRPGNKRYPCVEGKAAEADEIVQLPVTNHERLPHVEVRARYGRKTRLCGRGDERLGPTKQRRTGWHSSRPPGPAASSSTADSSP